MAIVKEIKKGATTFIFHDDCCKDTTPEEAAAISRQIAKAVLPALRAAHFRDQEKNETPGAGTPRESR